MTSLYTWLKFVHILSVGAFLFSHGVTGGISFLLRGPVSGATRSLLRASQISGQAAYPLLLVVLATGIWMTFAGSWGRQVWPWAGLGILIVTLVVMGLVARPYYMAREAVKGPDDAVAARLANTRPELAAGVGVVALVLIFGLMVFKPF
jgi:hypothetical protein